MMKVSILCVLVVVLHSAIAVDKMKKCPNPINGGWGDYGRWSPCSVTCGKGHQSRRRFCESPPAQFGGNTCAGDSVETKVCDKGLCPVHGVYGEWKYTACSAVCGGGTRLKYRSCTAPKAPVKGLCYEGCPDQKVVEECNTQRCNSCYACKEQAEKDAQKLGVANFVGHACRVDKKLCSGLSGGIKAMYPANYWFFLHCSADGPWCKPCATRGLVYNAKCGQCELTKDGECTGPGNWRNATKSLVSDTSDLELNDDEEIEDQQPQHHHRYPCADCRRKADWYAHFLGVKGFVGYACRTKKAYCNNKHNGIHKMYPATRWFFLQCSADGPWCKPCATRGLVYNPKCGSCEKSRYGKCSTPSDSPKNDALDDDELW